MNRLGLTITAVASAGLWTLIGYGCAHADPMTVATLERVNQQFNGSIHYEHTASWAPNTAVGDCKVYAVTKRAALLAAGWPADALDVQEVRTERGEDHAVLVARVGGAAWVLDNRFAWIEREDALERYGYRFGQVYAPWLLTVLAK